MELELQVCSLELAKKLKELGVKQDSLFVWYYIDGPSTYQGPEIGYTGSNLPSEASDIYGAFTVAELGDMLPKECWSRRANGGEHFYWCSWKTEKNEMHTPGNTEADARAKMLTYLIENKLITL